jgi:hypothetical protein
MLPPGITSSEAADYCGDYSMIFRGHRGQPPEISLYIFCHIDFGGGLIPSPPLSFAGMGKPALLPEPRPFIVSNLKQEERLTLSWSGGVWCSSP